jgi:hypothetical protein
MVQTMRKLDVSFTAGVQRWHKKVISSPFWQSFYRVKVCVTACEIQGPM